MPDHPDREQLAAFQAGDGDRRQRAEVEAHLAGCPACAEVVASVGQARRRLAVLEEPALPPGLHDRLAAAVEAEAPRPTAPDRQAPWYRRPVAWGAAAALLLAALIVPLLDRSSGNLSTAGGDTTSGESQEAATASGAADADRLPVIRIPGEVSAATVRSRLATDRRAKAALDAAASAPSPGAPGAQAATPRASQGAGPGTQSPDQAGSYRSNGSLPKAGTSSGSVAQAGPANLQPCLAAAANRASRPLRPAFFIQGSYQGREATILVTTSAGQPGRVDLWVFPRDTCSFPPLATEQVQ